MFHNVQYDNLLSDSRNIASVFVNFHKILLPIVPYYFQMLLVMEINLLAKMETAYKVLGNVMGKMTVEVVTSLMKKAVLVKKSIKHTLFINVSHNVRYDNLLSDSRKIATVIVKSFKIL